MNSRAKGARGEREARDLIRDTWKCVECVRSAQVSGKFSADLLGTPIGIHVEIKRPARLSVRKYLDQALADAQPDEVPVVVMREDKCKSWMILMPLSLSLEFAQLLSEHIIHVSKSDQENKR